jgi:anaerobic selenocysteine-containing dehydrogenase
LTHEEAFLIRRLNDHLGGGRIGMVEHAEGKDDDLLLRADRTPNRRGVIDICGAGGDCLPSIQELAGAIRGGSVRTLFVLKEDLLEKGASTGFDADLLSRLELLVVLDLFLTRTGDAAHVVFPAAGFVEDAGTFTNFEGRVQRVQPARRSPGAGQPGWMLLTLLGRALEGEFPYASADDVSRALGAAVPGYGERIDRLLGPETIAAAGGGGSGS